MTLDWQILLSAAILIGVAVMIWRGGSKNPVGTGQLQKQLNTIGAEVRLVKSRLESAASKADVEKLAKEIEEVEKRTASSGELMALSGELKVYAAESTGACETLGVKIDAVAKAAGRTEAGVQRIEGYFLKRGIEG